MKFVDLNERLAKGLEPVYLIEGEEAHFRDHALAAIEKACALSQPSLNEIRVEGETLKGDRLLSFRDDLYTLPFFDGRRLVRVHEFYPAERDIKTLSGYFEKPCPSTVLVIVNGIKKSELRKTKGVVFVDCARADEETLSRWLFSLMRRAGLSPDSDAMTLAVRYCANNAARLKSETEKLAQTLGEGGRVTRAVVEEYVAKDAEYKIYQLTQAASRRNYAEFTETLTDLMAKGYDENAALSSLTAHYRTLCELSGMKGTDKEVAQALGMNAYAVQKSREAASRLGKARTERIYSKLYALSCGARSGLYNKSGALTAAVCEIFFGE